MPSAKPSLLFVPGAWHNPTCLTSTASILEKEGCTCDLIALPSIGSERRSNDPSQDWNADVEEIHQRVMRRLDGDDVVLVVHSYGGTVGSEAVKSLERSDKAAAGKETAVTRLVSLNAIVLDIGSWIWKATNNEPMDPTKTTLKAFLF